MTTEQKAKAYDELLIKAKQIYNKENDVLIMHTIEDLFPELAESEDERIRKELIKVFSNREKYLIDQSFGDITVSEALTWLEKQGEHANFRNKIQIGDKVTRNEDGVLVNLSQLKRVAKKDEKQGEQKSQRMISAEAKEAMYDKPTDEDMKEALRTEYEKGRADAFAQMQKEWSEEDEQYLLVCKNALAKYQTTDKWDADIISCWLENKLKAPQNTWKPSDAQIRALEYIINNAHNTYYSCKIAKELLEQLRKLKGE